MVQNDFVNSCVCLKPCIGGAPFYDNGDFEAHLDTPGIKLDHERQANFIIFGTKLQNLPGTYFPEAGWHEKHWKKE